MSRLLMTLALLLIGGCASITPQLPSPHDAESAGLVMNLKVRLSGIATYRADVVYFTKHCSDPDEKCNDRLLISNYAKEGRVYLLNAEPGEYRAVAAAFGSGLPGDESVYFTYFPESFMQASAVTVRPRHLASAGNYLVSASRDVCPEDAEPGQLKYAEMIEPGTPKCGFFKTLAHKLATGDFIFIAGKAYLVGRQTFHYRATAYEEQQKAGDTRDFLESARADLAGMGWEFLTADEH